MNPLVQVRKFPTLEQAKASAASEAGDTASIALPVIAFHQGQRMMATGVLPMSVLRHRLESKSAVKGGTLRDTEAAWNRPEVPGHATAISKYLLENYTKRYILPSLAVNIQHQANLYVPDYSSDVVPGYLVIANSALLAITDGQHRRSGIVQAMEQMDEVAASKFGRDAVAVTISWETEVEQIHQDFADCSKTKQLSPSLLAVYDRRNPANRLVSDLEKLCPLFQGRIDSTGKSLSKKSNFLFLANQLRNLVKELLSGASSMNDVEFSVHALELLGTEDQYQKQMRDFVTYINYLTAEVIPVWGEIARLKVGTMAINLVHTKRAEGWMCNSSTGLYLIGRVGHVLFSNGEFEDRWKPTAAKLGEIDWKRATGPLWANVTSGDRASQSVLRRLYSELMTTIGMERYLPEPVLAGLKA